MTSSCLTIEKNINGKSKPDVAPVDGTVKSKLIAEHHSSLDEENEEYYEIDVKLPHLHLDSIEHNK